MIIDNALDIGTSRYDDDVLAAASQANRHRRSDHPIAFYGSSSFRMWRSLAADLGSLDVVNLGFGGGTFASAIHYMDALLVPINPAKVVLYFGENDISNDGLGAQTTVDQFEKLRACIVTALPQTRIYLLSAKQSPAKWLYADVVTTFNQLAAERCKQLDVCFIDVTNALLGETGRPMFRHYEPDLIHLNASGYALWASLLAKVPGLLLPRPAPKDASVEI